MPGCGSLSSSIHSSLPRVPGPVLIPFSGPFSSAPVMWRLSGPLQRQGLLPAFSSCPLQIIPLPDVILHTHLYAFQMCCLRGGKSCSSQGVCWCTLRALSPWQKARNPGCLGPRGVSGLQLQRQVSTPRGSSLGVIQ